MYETLAARNFQEWKHLEEAYVQHRTEIDILLGKTNLSTVSKRTIVGR